MAPTQEAHCQACTTNQKHAEQMHQRGAANSAFSNRASTAAAVCTRRYACKAKRDASGALVDTGFKWIDHPSGSAIFVVSRFIHTLRSMN